MNLQQIRRIRRQQGVSLVGLIIILALLAVVAMLAMKIIPAVVEYRSIRDAIYIAKAAGTTTREIQDSFTKQRLSGYFDAIGASDLEITKDGGALEVSFSYQKKIPLVGPASLVFDFEATTAKTNPLGGKKNSSAAE